MWTKAWLKSAYIIFTWRNSTGNEGRGGECTRWSRVRKQADGHKHSVWSWCWIHSGGGGRVRKASPHRCSQAAVRGTSTSPLNEDTLSKPENTTIAHLVGFFFFFFKIYSPFEGGTSFCLRWNILAYQVSLAALGGRGSKLKEGRGNFVFQHGPWNCWWMHFLSRRIHTQAGTIGVIVC